MKKTIILFGILLLAAAFSLAQEDTVTKTNYEFRRVSQNSFGTGEKLSFTINYMGVKAGDAVMEVAPDIIQVNGRDCYKINVTVKSSSSFEWVYKLDEKYECNLDAQGLFPWKFNFDKTQGKYKEQFEAIFDQENHKVKTFEGSSRTFKNEVSIPDYIQDQVSAFYYARTFDIPNMNEWDLINTFQVFDKEQAKSLDVKFMGREEVSVNSGKFRCIKVKPIGMAGGLFGAGDDLALWLTDDEVKMPVKIEIKIKVGSFNVELDSYQNVKPLNAKL